MRSKDRYQCSQHCQHCGNIFNKSIKKRKQAYFLDKIEQLQKQNIDLKQSNFDMRKQIEHLILHKNKYKSKYKHIQKHLHQEYSNNKVRVQSQRNKIHSFSQSRSNEILKRNDEMETKKVLFRSYFDIKKQDSSKRNLQKKIREQITSQIENKSNQMLKQMFKDIINSLVSIEKKMNHHNIMQKQILSTLNTNISCINTKIVRINKILSQSSHKMEPFVPFEKANENSVKNMKNNDAKQKNGHSDQYDIYNVNNVKNSREISKPIDHWLQDNPTKGKNKEQQTQEWVQLEQIGKKLQSWKIIPDEEMLLEGFQSKQ